MSTESARPPGPHPGAELEADATVNTRILPADGRYRLNASGWPVAIQQTPAERKLGELCDADQRATSPSLQAVAAAITAGAPMPDPYRQQAQFRAVLEAARTYLAGEPSPRSIKAAAQRLTTAITSLGADMAKEDGR